MRTPRSILALLGLLTTMLAAAPASAHSLENLENQLRKSEAYVEITDRAAPAFTLRDATGQTVRLEDLRGQVVVLWFIYTSCPDLCPLHSDTLAGIQEQINATPMRDLVRFVAITTDPLRDTADVLKLYGEQHGLDPANTILLTSGAAAPAATRALAERFGVSFSVKDEDYQLHGAVTHLIDKNGFMRARYHGLNFNPTNLIVHINALTNETTHAEDAPAAAPWWRRWWRGLTQRSGLE